MSAFMVSREHIDAMVATAIDGPIDGPGIGRWHDMVRWNLRQIPGMIPEDYSESEHLLGEMLVKENLSSIHARYPDTITNPDATPEPIDQYWLQEYKLPNGTKRLTVVQMLKALDCYEYQSCEHPEWESSVAKRFRDGIRDNLISCLPGYEKAAWEIVSV